MIAKLFTKVKTWFTRTSDDDKGYDVPDRLKSKHQESFGDMLERCIRDGDSSVVLYSPVE